MMLQSFNVLWLHTRSFHSVGIRNSIGQRFTDRSYCYAYVCLFSVVVVVVVSSIFHTKMLPIVRCSHLAVIIQEFHSKMVRSKRRRRRKEKTRCDKCVDSKLSVFVFIHNISKFLHVSVCIFSAL